MPAGAGVEGNCACLARSFSISISAVDGGEDDGQRGLVRVIRLGAAVSLHLFSSIHPV